MKNRLLYAIFSVYSICYAECKFIDKDVQTFMQRNQVNGVAIALIQKESIQYCNYGYTDSNKKNKVSEKTLFEIASLTKTFTANLIAIAQLDGKLNIYNPITTYLPELKTNSYYSKINTLELLTHVANIPAKLSNTQTESDLINSLIKIQYTKNPETDYIYSNPGITLSGIILERLYKKTYQDVLSQQLLDKLNMQYTFVKIPLKYQSLLSNGYNNTNTQIPTYKSGALVPSGGLKSNTHDLALYLKYQINGSQDTLLNNALAIIHKDYYCIGGIQYQQLAWNHMSDTELDKIYNDQQTLQTHKIGKICNFQGGFIAKSGTLYGMSSYMAYSPHYKDGVIILINKGLVGDRVRLATRILKLLESNL